MLYNFVHASFARIAKKKKIVYRTTIKQIYIIKNLRIDSINKEFSWLSFFLFLFIYRDENVNYFLKSDGRLMHFTKLTESLTV